MTRQWKRKISLVVGDDSGNGLELAEMHISFSVRHGIVPTPHNLEARIYNLSDSTAQRIKDEFTRVLLQAGYEGGYGPIFGGTIKQVRRGHATSTDSFVDIFAAEGDEAYNWAVTNQSLAAGYTAQDQYAAIGKAMSRFGISAVALPDGTFPSRPAPRGRVLWGMARDHAEDLAATHDMTWHMRDGGLYVNPVQPPAPDSSTAIVLNSNTGLIGFPEQTQGGIFARCLLNPAINAGTLVQIDNKSVQEAGQSPTVDKLPSIADDGLYRVLFRDHVGDTRGQNWYTEMTCDAVNGPIHPPPSPAVAPATGT